MGLFIREQFQLFERGQAPRSAAPAAADHLPYHLPGLQALQAIADDRKQ